MKQYNFDGLAGCVIQRKSRATGTMVGLYQASQSGMESDPATPWCTVCEVHSTLVCHETLKDAKLHLSCAEWCEECTQQRNQ